MTINRLLAIRSISGKTGAILCVLIALIVIDSLISRFRDPFNVIHLVRGGSQQVTGILPDQVESTDDMLSVSETHLISIDFQEIFSGFWLGNPMWRGTIAASPDTVPGEYQIKIRGRSQLTFNPALIYAVRVYLDELALQKSHGPFLKRHVGLLAGHASLILFPVIGLIVLFNYLLSGILEKRMASMGRAEIYMIKQIGNGHRFAFSLGTRQGVRVGEIVDILNGSETMITEAVVLETNPDNAIARTDAFLDIRQTVIIQRRIHV
jgi:hypothetical protein